MSTNSAKFVKPAITLGLSLLMIVLAGCRAENRYTARRDTISLSAGEATARNKAIHVIDPWPAKSQDADFHTDGKRMMIGIERYQANDSLEPEGSDTTERFEDEQSPPGGPPAGP